MSPDGLGCTPNPDIYSVVVLQLLSIDCIASPLSDCKELSFKTPLNLITLGALSESRSEEVWEKAPAGASDLTQMKPTTLAVDLT